MDTVIKALKDDLLPHMHKRILLPAVDSFDELFESATKIEDLSKYKSHDAHVFLIDDPYHKRRKGRATISSFVGFTSKECRSFDVKPTELAIKTVSKNMLLIPDYRINFEVRVWKDGLALVTAHYSQISGSHWFAIIDSTTIPS
ncbi:MAG TPA: hypothetical protein VIE65_12445 [Methylobacter sp.]